MQSQNLGKADACLPKDSYCSCPWSALPLTTPLRTYPRKELTVRILNNFQLIFLAISLQLKHCSFYGPHHTRVSFWSQVLPQSTLIPPLTQVFFFLLSLLDRLSSEQTDLIMYSLVQMKWHGLLHHKLLYKRSHNKNTLHRIFQLDLLFSGLPS